MLPDEDAQTHIVRDRPEFAGLNQTAFLHLLCHHSHGTHREDCKAQPLLQYISDMMVYECVYLCMDVRCMYAMYR